MVSNRNTEQLQASTKPLLAEAWSKYRIANELLEKAESSQALALLAQAEMIFRTHNDARGLWRTLIGQALLHWRDGMAEVAEARGLAALQAAELADDGFAVGYVTWQLASMKIEQQHYTQAADYLDQAQLALDAVGLAPAGGVLAAAGQLCTEVVRWQQMRDRQHIGAREAEAAVGAIHADLLIRLRQAASAMQIVATQEHSEENAGEGMLSLAPVALPPVDGPSLPWIGLSAWLGRLWRKLIYGDDLATAQRVMRAPMHSLHSELMPAASFMAVAEAPLLVPAATSAAWHSEAAQVDDPTLATASDGLAPDSATLVAPANLALQELEIEPERVDNPGAREEAPLAQPDGEASSDPANLLLFASRAAPKAMAPVVERASLALDVPEERRGGSSTLSVRMLGPFSIVVNGSEVESWSSGRGRAVFKYMLTHRERPLARDVLMEVFWPEAAPESARNSLNVAMYGLRQALRAAADVPVVLFQNGTYRLNPELQIWLDVEEFRRSVQSGRRCEQAGDLQGAAAKFEQAAELYRGDFLADDLGDDWPVLPRERLRVDYLDTLDRLSHIYFTQEQYSSCIVLCQMILAEDNCREDVHCRLIHCYSRQNQHHLALRQYQTCVEALERELGVAPATSTTQLYERIRRRETV